MVAGARVLRGDRTGAFESAAEAKTERVVVVVGLVAGLPFGPGVCAMRGGGWMCVNGKSIHDTWLLLVDCERDWNVLEPRRVMGSL